MTFNETVKLNVGGQSFETNRAKLIESSTYFKNLLEGDMKKHTLVNQDEIFIERCGTHFECILQYLRTGHISGGNNVRLQDLQQEAQFYQLDKLVHALDTMEKSVKFEYSLMDLSDLIPHPTIDTRIKSLDILHVVDVKQSHTICWQHASKYGVPNDCQHGRGGKKSLNQLTAKLLVKKGI